jgi:hypothetical protein
MPGVGVADSAEEAVTYIMSLSRDVLEERLVRAYVEAGAEMVGFLDPEAGTDFYVAEGSPDYHPEHPGGKPQGGRTLETPLFPGAMLGNMREAWWSPVADLPPGVNDMNRVMVDADRTRPRSIMVNRRGRRFTNEAANYNAFGGAFHAPELDDAPTPAAPAHRHLAVYELDGDVDEVMAEFAAPGHLGGDAARRVARPRIDRAVGVAPERQPPSAPAVRRGRLSGPPAGPGAAPPLGHRESDTVTRRPGWRRAHGSAVRREPTASRPENGSCSSRWNTWRSAATRAPR